MLVQDRPNPKSPKTHNNNSNSSNRALPTVHPNRFSESKSLDFSTWASENLYKIVTILLLIATVAALFFLRNVGDTAALLCFESQSQQLETIHFPKINWNSIEPIVDKTTPYANFRSEKWVVVSVSDYPSDSLKNLVKIKGWQVLAIGNSKTPSDWSLKGTIFLSLEQQAQLGFRVVDFLPYDSYVRKTVGYLFAIQHGAKKIFDADDRGDVIDNDIGKHFDVELVGEGARQEVILQYSHENPNRTVVNPYVHFGQRSVWPRGMPLENVGEIGHEDYYTEVFGGKQFIQQGISNGLPDVDSVFYFTRKSGLEAFDIRFDERAQKVALPQGMMVPVNSFNTLYHSSAFWALMLPVSVSTMASDVLRGYWGQRLLWEIGGFVVVYPPTVHRYDRIEGYPFSEEKDLHVNVGRLTKFLVSWRSGKHRLLFEKILELSYAMAEEGFWSEKDVKFTAAWLQDLLAVRYQQPRLMTLELDRPRATIGHGDRKEFVPQKLPSVHLGVEEIGTVNYEIGNLIRWRKTFGNVVLIMFCSGPVERTALEWRLLYGRIFKTVIILAVQKNEDLVVEEGRLDYLYKQLPSIFNRYSSAEGFLFLHDDTIINYWNLLQADKTKLWITDKVPESWTPVRDDGNSDWFTKQAELVNKVVNSMPVHFQVSYKESMPDPSSTTLCSSEVFYVPRRFVSDFIDLVNLVGDLDMHQKVAVPMIFLSMDLPQNFDPVFGTMIYKPDQPSTNSTPSYSPEVPAVHPWGVSSEQEFIKLVRIMAAGDPLLMELV
ncbi:probable glycosyltransferase STELLO2 [Rhododendron vialii]|uniref:probable glycosyltransferase STELLO2 n=1 Tax=Rhododendron vialii TaxID=182163 RepID=UPI00265F6B8C|nr:probable glycosyltransferase STELLO2 [Rhododendron vialii]